MATPEGNDSAPKDGGGTPEGTVRDGTPEGWQRWCSRRQRWCSRGRDGASKSKTPEGSDGAPEGSDGAPKVEVVLPKVAMVLPKVIGIWRSDGAQLTRSIFREEKPEEIDVTPEMFAS